MPLTVEEKEKIIETLEKDKEFRYALAGLLGFSEILDRIVSLEERFAKLEERFAKLEERVIRLEERFAKLEERFAKLEERQLRVEEELVRLRRTVDVIAHRFGVLSEEAFREGMRYVIEEQFGKARVERLMLRDTEGLVYGHPSVVEVDVLIRDDAHILLEVKSRVSKGDVAELHRIGELYERRTGVRPVLAIIGGHIDEGAKELALGLGIDIRPVIR